MPVVPRFKVPQAIKTLKKAKKAQEKMANQQRRLMRKLRAMNLLCFDLNKVFMGGENRLPLGSKYTEDGVHPNERGVGQFYKALFRMLVNINVMKKLSRSYKST